MMLSIRETHGGDDKMGNSDVGMIFASQVFFSYISHDIQNITCPPHTFQNTIDSIT